MHRIPAFEAILTSVPTVIGKRIHGMLAYPGISRNNRMYTLGALSSAPESLPLILNHKTIQGTEGIPESLLPAAYKERLEQGQEIILGEIHPKFDFDTYRLNYTAEVSDPHFSQQHILENMSVSLGLLFPKSPKECDAVACYEMVKEAIWKEVSLVFRPGFDIATLSTESNGSLSSENCHCNQMASNKITGTSDITNKAIETVGDGTGQPSAPAPGQCPEGMAHNATTGQCEKIETAQNSNPSTPAAPPVIDKSTEQNGPDEDEDQRDAALTKKKKAEEAFNEYRKRIDALYPSTEGLQQSHKDNADLKSENARTTNYHNGLEKAESLDNLGLMKKANEVREEVIKSLGLEKDLREAKEAVKPQARIPTPQTAQIAGVTIANEAFLPDNAYTWFKQVQAEELNIPKTKEYRVNKQYIYENHPQRFYKDWNIDALGIEKVGYKPIPMNSRKEATEVLTSPSADGDFINTMSEQVIVDPQGKFTTPIRQFSDVQVLSPGQKTGLFYDISKPTFGAVDEGGTGVPETAITIRSAGGKTTPRGGLVTLKYSEVEELPFDSIAKLNQGFAVESLVDETRLAVNTAFNTDTAHSPTTDRKPIGGGVKTGRWVNGNDGALNPTDTGAALGVLDYAGLLAGKGVIEDSGFFEGIQMYTSGKAIRDISKSVSVDSYIQFSRPLIITEGTVERIAGVNLIRSSELPLDGTLNNNLRSCMFATGAFGIVTGRDLTMEAQRRNEFQTILLTGTQKVLVVVRMLEKTCRVSHTA